MKQPRTVLFETFAINGMTLRDYFAARAMEGSIASQADGVYDRSKLAEWCYVMADQMIEAREKK